MEWIIGGVVLEVIAVVMWLHPEPLVWLSDRTLGRYAVYIARRSGRWLGREVARGHIKQYKHARASLRWFAGFVALFGLRLMFRGLY